MVATSTEITVYDRVADPAAFVESFGKSMYEARMFGCSNEAQGRVLALACIAERKNPLELVRTYHIIDGKLSMRADAMLAEFRKRGGKVRWVETGDDGKQAKAVFSFEGVDTEIAYTIDDAKRAGLIRDKSAWTKDPGAMLRARLVSRAIRMLCPEIVAGYYTPEEIEDVAGGGDAKPAVVVDAEAIAKAAASKANGKAAAKAADAADAEFVDKPVADAKPPEPVAAKSAKPGELEKPCSAVERERIQQLFSAVGVLPEQQTKALEKRGAKVIRNLTAGQARELIAKLESQIAAAPVNAPVANESSTPPTEATDATEAAPFDSSADFDGPCSLEQVAAIKSLLIEMDDPALVTRINERLTECGIRKLAELSWRDATTLHRALDCRQMEEFFGASLTKAEAKGTSQEAAGEAKN